MLKLHHNYAVYDRHSKPNAKTERKLANSSVKSQNQGKMLDSPSKVQKGPEYLKMHPTGVRSYEHSKTKVSSKVKHDISLTLPGMHYVRAMYAQLYPIQRSCFRVSEGPKLCHSDAVNEGCSKLNVIHKWKVETDGFVSNASRVKTKKNTNLPGKTGKGPDKVSGMQ